MGLFVKDHVKSLSLVSRYSLRVHCLYQLLRQSDYLEPDSNIGAVILNAEPLIRWRMSSIPAIVATETRAMQRWAAREPAPVIAKRLIQEMRNLRHELAGWYRIPPDRRAKGLKKVFPQGESEAATAIEDLQAAVADAFKSIGSGRT
jgi:hypothetical protein